MTLDRALINVQLGDGHFWRHPQAIDSCIVWTSIHKDWLEWKRLNLLPKDLRLSIQVSRKAGASNCYPNAKTLYSTTSKPDAAISEARSMWTKQRALEGADLADLAVWYLDDGCCVFRKDSVGSYRVTIAVGATTAQELFPHMTRILHTQDLGRVYKNNSRATERNMSWIVPKPAAVQILGAAREIAPDQMQYKVPLW